MQFIGYGPDGVHTEPGRDHSPQRTSFWQRPSSMKFWECVSLEQLHLHPVNINNARWSKGNDGTPNPLKILTFRYNIVKHLIPIT